tara:strand:+ start:4144 stop:5211 length:1068 start_codon:yes stop_codon:yes gene_type:complete
MDKRALVVGVSGITGNNVAKKLIEQDWKTYGLARNPEKANVNGLHPIAADLLDFESLSKALAEVKPTHIYIATWMRKQTEAENIKVNSKMIKNLLLALSPGKSVQHVALVTGLKHYLGPFDSYAQGELPQTPFREEQARLEVENFYYAQEDEVYAAADRDGFTWSIHRPHTVIGKAVGNMMNMGTTLAVYASICKETGKPFKWPGSKAQWEGISDMTDANILAEHLIWASTNEKAKNEAFNITNGDVFRWRWMWEKIAEYFEVDIQEYDGTIHPLEEEMANDANTWKEMANKNGLKEAEINKLASPWHTDLDLGRPMEIMTDMSKSRKLGFKEYIETRESFFNLFDELREEKLIP